MRFPYTIERGVRFPDEPIPLIGFRRHVMETREPLMINEDIEIADKQYGNPAVMSGEPSKSGIWMPLVVGGEATGVISIQNLDREHAFTESDQQLLATLTRSLGVALENARLIDETRRRAAELAIVNSVGQALAAHLDLPSLIDLVGEKMRETFDADIVYVALHEPGERHHRLPLLQRARETDHLVADRLRRGIDVPHPPVARSLSCSTERSTSRR